MPSGNEPWLERWEIVKKLGKGGQGTTVLVRERSTGQTAVLKTLKDNESQKARDRMRQEVLNLDILAKAGAKVPGVLDQNALQPPDNQTRLYLVMDFVEGKTLHDLVGEKGRLTWDEAVRLATALGYILREAHERRIIHRDLKPKNIMVRDLATNDLVLIDFGLSFNEDEAMDLTDTEETVGNIFYRLPEGAAGSRDKRDRRSDVARLVAVLHYCLTGVTPLGPLDHNSLPPHRRTGCSAHDILGDDPRAEKLDVFFNRGFQNRMENRFQTCDELLQRLDAINNPDLEAPEDVVALAARLSANLEEANLGIQANLFQNAIDNVVGKLLSPTLHDYTRSCQDGFGHFFVGQGSHPDVPQNIPGVTSYTPIMPGITLTVRAYGGGRLILFLAAARGKECCLFVRIVNSKQDPSLGPSAADREWKEVTCFDVEKPPSPAQLVKYIDAVLHSALQSLYAEVNDASARKTMV